MAQVVLLPAANPLLDFPSEDDGRGATVDALSAFSRETHPLALHGKREMSASSSPRPVERSRMDAGYSEFMKILARAEA
jgi:hypothetical protein